MKQKWALKYSYLQVSQRVKCLHDILKMLLCSILSTATVLRAIHGGITALPSTINSFLQSQYSGETVNIYTEDGIVVRTNVQSSNRSISLPIVKKSVSKPRKCGLVENSLPSGSWKHQLPDSFNAWKVQWIIFSRNEYRPLSCSSDLLIIDPQYQQE